MKLHDGRLAIAIAIAITVAWAAALVGCGTGRESRPAATVGAEAEAADAAVAPPPLVEAEWFQLLGGRSATTLASVAPGFEPARFGGNGPIEESEAGVRLEAGAPLTGITFPAGQSTVLTPCGAEYEYEIEVVAARLAGTDFFCALTFPVDAAALTLVLGGWGGSTCGFSCLDGRDAANNPTTTWRRFDKGVFVSARVRVTRDRIEAFVDGEPLCSTPRAGVVLSLRPEVEPCRPLGIASYATTAMIRSARWRPLPEGSSAPAAAPLTPATRGG